MIPEALFSFSYQNGDFTMACCVDRCSTKKLRNSGGVAHIDDFVRSGLPPCITLGTVTVTIGERLPAEIAGKEGGRRWLNPTMS